MFFRLLAVTGGLGLQEVQLAGPLAFGGLCLILVSLLAYPPLQKALGTLTVAKQGLALAVLVSLAIPAARFAVPNSFVDQAADALASTQPISSSPGGRVAAVLVSGGEASAAAAHIHVVASTPAAGDLNQAMQNQQQHQQQQAAPSGIGWAAWAVLYSAMLGKNAAACAAFTGAIVMVNALSRPEQLGAVNGVGQTLASLARGVGPAVAGVLWGATVEGLRVQGAQMVPYLMVALTAILGLVIYCCLRPFEGVEVVGRGGRHGTSCCQE